MKVSKATKVVAAIAGVSLTVLGGGFIVREVSRGGSRTPGEPSRLASAPSASVGAGPVVFVDPGSLGIAAAALAQPAGSMPAGSMSAAGVGDGVATRKPDGGYAVKWTSAPVFVTRKPERDIQYRGYGGDVRLEVRARVQNEAQARWWLDVMARGASGSLTAQKVWSDKFYQGAVVFPAPPTKSASFQCVGLFPAPGANPAKNIACGRFAEQRAKIEVAIYQVEGGFVGVWPWGSVAAGPDLEVVKAIALAAVEQINTFGRSTSGSN
jgi:hypothetical protein